MHLVIFAYDNGLTRKEPGLASNRENTVPIDHGRRTRVATRVREGELTDETNHAGTAAVRVTAPSTPVRSPVMRTDAS